MQPSPKGKPGGSRSSLSTRIFLGQLALVLVFCVAMVYSLINHDRTASELGLLSRGYLTISFSIVEMRATQRVYDVLLERLPEEPEPLQAMVSLSSARLLRPVILADLGKIVKDLESETRIEEERRFLDRVIEDLDRIEKLYEKGTRDYAKLEDLLAKGHTPESGKQFRTISADEREIETTLRRLQSSSVQRINRLTARAEQRERWVLWMFTALILASLGFALLVTLYVRSLLLPLVDLSRGAEAIGRGDLDHRIRVRRLDEIGRYAAEFNQMAAALKERDARLRHAERLAAIGKMASHIAHEVRNPLSSVGLNAEMIVDEARTLPDSPSRAEIIGLAGRVGQEVDRLTGITKHYLELGRLPNPEPVPVKVGDLARKLAEFVGPDLAKRSVKLEVKAEGDGPTVPLDPDQIRQVLMNLVRNAGEAMEEGEPGSVEIRVAADGDVVRLSVVDDGRGMAPEELAHLFEPFYTTRAGGTGLGLPLTRHIVERHGGRIECFSEKGKGTTFVVTLPAKPA